MSVSRVCVVAICILFLCSAVPCLGMVSGTVSDAFGNPVSGAVVTFTKASNPKESFSATTDAKGTYRTETATSISENTDRSAIPGMFVLSQNYPNPFNPSTVIPFFLNAAGDINLTVYNIQGQRIRTLADGHFPAGPHTVEWNGADDRGTPSGAGIYFYRLRVGNITESRKMLLLDGGGNIVSGSAFPAGKTVSPGKLKPVADLVFQVNITGNDIVPFTVKNMTIAEGGAYDFTVVRKVPDTMGITFVCIPGGTFRMGNVENVLHSKPDTEAPVHNVTVSPFRMSEAEITNAQYCAFLNEELASGNITATAASVTGAQGLFKGYTLIELSGTWEPDYPDNRCWITYSDNSFHVAAGKGEWPVVYVTWYGAKDFAYHYGWDLPREAEWEHASRAGKQYKYGTDDGTISKAKANYHYDIMDSNYKYHPVDVKSYPPNPFGLYDMCGNALEWCNDWYDIRYSGEDATDPTGPQSGEYRVVRGGSWFHDEMGCRSSSRDYRAQPNFTLFHQSFRIVSR